MLRNMIVLEVKEVIVMYPSKKVSPQHMQLLVEWAKNVDQGYVEFATYWYGAMSAFNSLNEEKQSVVINEFSKIFGAQFVISDEHVEPESHALPQPEYLTTLDVAYLLGISTQMVRRHLEQKKIAGWRTLGDRGEWRIEFEPYKDHPNMQDLLKRIAKQSSPLTVIE